MSIKRSTTALLQNLRTVMQNRDIVQEPLSAYIVPSGDAHHSEYIAPCDERRSFICSFNGSAGTAVITLDKALLWTDGRYYLQATDQLDENWTLMKLGLPETLTQAQWLTKNLPTGSLVGVDPCLFSIDEWDKMSKELKLGGLLLSSVPKNLVDSIWEHRPCQPVALVVQLPVEFSGRTAEDKVKAVRSEMKDAMADVLLISELDEIAWLLNLRGSDIKFNPVFFSYLIVTQTGMELFINASKLSEDVRSSLNSDGVVIHPYETVAERVQFYAVKQDEKIWLSKNCNFALANTIPKSRQYTKLTPVKLMKAIKNPVEVEGMRNAHIRDAAALCCFFAWLEEAIEKGENITEVSAASKLENFREVQEHYRGLSFETISGSGPNGAIIHYQPNLAPESRKLSIDEMYLVDSGGQYMDGTTDVTRTLHFGTPSDYQKDCFTRVLKGQIALTLTVFPNKIVGNYLDTLARKYLWDVGLDYGHGTGHGIGHYLNVHEGPHGISWRHLPDDPGLQENMFVSNEPGYYEEGQFGVRIENIIRIKKANPKHNFNNRGYLTFEDITLVPIQQKLIKIELLTPAEIEYIDEYHTLCRKTVGSYMDANNIEEAGFKWLIKETEPLR